MIVSQRQQTAEFYEVRIEAVPLGLPPTCASSIATAISTVVSDHGGDPGSLTGETVSHSTTVTASGPSILFTALATFKNDGDNLLYEVPPDYTRLDLASFWSSMDSAYRAVASGASTATHVYLENVPWAPACWAMCQCVIPTSATAPVQHAAGASLPVAATPGNLMLAAATGGYYTPPLITPPDGWTEIFYLAAMDPRGGQGITLGLWARCATEGESNFYPFSGQSQLFLSEWEVL